jgi:hypothetical protein
MNTNQSKPSLEALLQSKKYDLPNDEFWNVLQDSVKGKALASLAEQPLSHRFLKSSFIILPVLLLTFFFSSSFYSVSSTLPSTVLSSASPSLITELEEKQILHDFRIIQDLESLDYEYTDSTSVAFLSINDKSTFAEKNLELNQENSFEIQYLSNFEHHQDDLLSQYTF